LDLGCGYGRTAIYLARQGWEVDGIDFVPLAIAEARSRARRAGLINNKVQFHNASVADLHFLQAPYDLAVDIGCLHALGPEDQAGYEASLKRLLRPGAWYLLFARLQDEEAVEDPDGPRGIAEETVRRLFSENFLLQKDTPGWTEVEDGPAWKSGWFWFRRR